MAEIEMVRREPPQALVQELQRALPNVRVVWDMRKGLWEIQERGRQSGKWYYTAYWADAAGPYRVPVYRELPLTAGPIREFLHSIDIDRFRRLGGSDKDAWKRLSQEMDETRLNALREHQAKFADAAKQYVTDLFERGGGVRQTFGMGKSGGSAYGRSRLWLARGSDVMRRFVQQLKRGAS